jgi:hypothetical protein
MGSFSAVANPQPTSGLENGAAADAIKKLARF